MKAKTRKLPSKQTINLVAHQNDNKHPLRTFLAITVIVVALLLVAKFAVLDRFLAVAEERTKLEDMQNELTMVQLSLADYNEVETEYNRRSTSWMTNPEKATVDRQQVMMLIAQEIFSSAQVERYTVTENTLSLDLTGVTLNTTADIVSRLEARDEVAKVQVYTANSKFTSGASTSVSLVITLQNEESIRQEEAARQAAIAAEAAAAEAAEGGTE